MNGGNDIIYDGAGDDLVLSGGGDDRINDTIIGGGEDRADSGQGNDIFYGGQGNDFVYGGDGSDIVVGGPGSDFLDGGFGNDTLYVDIFDAWAGGMPEDTIVGGSFYSTGFTFDGDKLDRLGLSEADSAAENLALAFARLAQTAQNRTWLDDGAWPPGGRTFSTIFESTIMVSLMDHGYDSIRWGRVGEAILALAARESGTPHLIGIGDFIEQQWSELLALAN
jgi:hypothetical protein